MKVASATLPTEYGIFEIMVFKSKNNLEHVALIKGENFDDEVLVRIHSSCLTGDTFSSLRCDCRKQLQQSLTKIGKAKNGILIYLNQEGRGIGLTNKIKAYDLQDKGYDTIEANEALGFPSDLRSYKTAADILKSLGVTKIALLTNNPDKIDQLAKFGINISRRIALEAKPHEINISYMRIKKRKMNHNLKFV